MKELLCDWILSCVLTVQPVTPLPDLYYGTVLYDYYQDDYQQALLDALIVERRGAVGDDPVRLQLAKGSFAFADGMFAMAEQTFASVGDGELTPLDKMRLSFHLAREDFRRQDWAGVERNVANIDLGKSWLGHERIHPEVEFMRAEVATQKRRFRCAHRTRSCGSIPKQAFRAYALFNLGVAERAAGAAGAGRTDVHDARHDGRVRRRRARPQAARLVALSVVKRQRAEAASAESVIGGLPAEGRYRDLALTSYGGLAMDNGDYELAARIWLSLKKDAYWSESSATAQLGFPMSLEHMSSRELALTQLSSGRGDLRRTPFRTSNRCRARRRSGVGRRTAAGVCATGRRRQHRQRHERVAADARPHRLARVARDRGRAGTAAAVARTARDAGVAERICRTNSRRSMRLSVEQRRRAAAARELIDTRGLRERREHAAQTLAEMRARVDALAAATPERTSEWMLALANADEAKLLEWSERQARAADADARRCDTRAAARARRTISKGSCSGISSRIESTRLRAVENETTQTAEQLAEIDAKLARVARAEDVLAAGVQTDFLAFQTRADAITREVAVAIARSRDASRRSDPLRDSPRNRASRTSAAGDAHRDCARDRSARDGPDGRRWRMKRAIAVIGVGVLLGGCDCSAATRRSARSARTRGG